MDEFGVLVESIGFRAHGKSAPMAKSKPKPQSHFPGQGAAFDDSHSWSVDELDGIFRSNVNVSKPQQSQNFFGADDIFGGSVSSIDLDSVFSTSNNWNNNNSNLNSRNSVGSASYDDLLGSTVPKSNPSGAVDDLFGGFAANKKRGGWDDLIPGLSGTSPSNTEVNSDASVRPSNSKSSGIDDPFLVFESSGPKPDASWPFDPPSKAKQDTGTGSSQSSIDDFLMGTTSNNTRSVTTQNGSGNTDYMDAIFGGGNSVPQKNAAKQSSTNEDYPFGNFFHEKKQPEAKHAPPSSGTRNGSFPKNAGNDFTSLFGDITTTSGEFHEIDGEPEERRKARLNRHMRTNARMAEALAEKNQRDLLSQHEQEEKRRLAETLNNDIKRWAAGKEGNLRALLSSLQQVLWPECGWRPVSLTDMITSESVKKVYKKATLSVHPDKVQQKGANVEQKYIAEKVFDILKEAWNKFSAEELR